MPDQRFEFYPTDDVLEARRCAQDLLAQTTGAAESLRAARLLLTAVCLHIHAGFGPEPNIGDLRALLVRLQDSAASWVSLSQSPIQFVRYAAAEVLDAGGALRPAFELALAALS